MKYNITRFFKVIWYSLTGRAHRSAEKLMNNPEAVDAAYEDLIRAIQSNIQSYKQVIGQFIPIVEQKKNSLKDLTNDIVELEKKKSDANDKSKSVTIELKNSGISDNEIKQHPNFVRCVAAYNDFHAILEKKNARVAKLEQEIERAIEGIEPHKLQITSLHRDLEDIKAEQSEAITDLITAREQEEIEKRLSDISPIDVPAELARIREIRAKTSERVTQTIGN